MENENDISPHNKVVTTMEQKELKQWINFSYKTAITYLTYKYSSDKSLIDSEISKESFAINISALIFSEEETGKIRLACEHEKIFNDLTNKNDFESLRSVG